MNILVLLGSIAMFLAVALGAFGAHALKKRLSVDLMKVFETGVQYHIAHALGLILLGMIAESSHLSSSLVHTAGWLLLVGIILFSGSLYALTLTGIRRLGAITPIGGIAFLAGWATLMIAVLQG